MYQRISTAQTTSLSRLVCPLELTQSGSRNPPAIPAHAGALVVWPLAERTLAELAYCSRTAFQVAWSVLQALATLHSLDIGHADMSSTNILIRGSGSAIQACFCRIIFFVRICVIIFRILTNRLGHPFSPALCFRCL